MTTDYCDMCKGDTRLPIQSMPIGLRCDCGWHFHVGHQLLADATAEIRCPMCSATCRTLEVKPFGGEPAAKFGKTLVEGAR